MHANRQQLYRLTYVSIYREKEWIPLIHGFKANSDAAAARYAQQLIKRQNKKISIERFEFCSLERIVQREKVVPVPVS